MSPSITSVDSLERKQVSFHGSNENEFTMQSNILPCALLPVHRFEPAIHGIHTLSHRRGAGLPWPPEAQAPVGGEPSRSVGRVPLILAWAALLPKPESRWEPLGDLRFSWIPGDRDEAIGLNAQEIILENLYSLTHPNQPVLVVPDSLNEFGQQALLDQARPELKLLRLIPRPMAIARNWCKQHREEYKDEGIDDPEGKCIGYLRVMHLGMDCWELVLVPIHATLHKGKTHLFPVRNRRDDMLYELPYWGIAAILGLEEKNGSSDFSEGWHSIFAEETLQKQWWGKPRPDSFDWLNKFLQNGIANNQRKILSEWPHFKPLIKHLQPPTQAFRSEIHRVFHSQRESVKDMSCRGTIICGSFAELQYGSELFAHHCASLLPKSGGDETKPKVWQHNAPALGAYQLAQAIKNNAPSYRDTLISIEIHTRTVNETQDEIDEWIALVEAKTVEAGDDYVPDKPIPGAHIKAGDESLKLILQRKGFKKDFDYRSIRADLRNPIAQKEKVEINVCVRPGQGHARVKVTSLNPGVFETLLDWKTMEDCEKPAPPMLKYIPGVTIISSTTEHLYACRPQLSQLIEAVESNEIPDTATLISWIKELREGPTSQAKDSSAGMNKWPMTVQYPTQQDDFFKHSSLFGSDGGIDGDTSARLLPRFLEVLNKLYISSYRHSPRSTITEGLIRLGGWCYLAIPVPILEDIRESFRKNTQFIRKVDRDSAGLCFHKNEDLKMFYKRLIEAIETRRKSISAGHVKPQKGDVNNDWWRALRNIVRFRENALSRDVISLDQVYEIVDGIILLLTREVNQRASGPLFVNGIKATIYLMKRRRYDPAFLSENCQRRKNLQSLLEDARPYLQSDTTDSFVYIALKFLNKEATDADLLGFLGSDKG
jgi:hypothetical protein